MASIILRSSLRYMKGNPWQFLLSILGIALGVAVVISIDIANESAKEAFSLSAQTVTGKSTHQITGASTGLSEEIYRELRLEGKVRPIAPVVEGYVAACDYSGLTFHLLGIDPLADNSFRPYLARSNPLKEMSLLMTEPSTCMITDETARQLGLKEGDTITIRAGSIKKKVLIAGLIKPYDDLSKKALKNLLLTDISTAQELLDEEGRLSWIDIIIPEGDEGEKLLNRIKEFLPKNTKIIDGAKRNNTIKQMTRAFNINLSAMSMLALLVGMFLIYNTMTFSVVRRRKLIGMLRAIGVTRVELFSLILGEALIAGITGTIIGLAAGIILGKGMISLVTQAINDIYFVLQVTKTTISPASLIKGILLGIFATLGAAFIPALEATTPVPGNVMKRSTIEKNMRSSLLRTGLTGISLIIFSPLLLLLPKKNLILSISVLFIIVLGFALITPACVVIMTELSSILMKRLFGITGQMSARSITASLSRTAVAIAALMVALSVTIGVGIMVGSLRYAVILWMENFLKANIYISPPSLVYSRSDLTIDPVLAEKLCSTPGISEIITYRGIMLEKSRGLIELVSMNISPKTYNTLRFKEGDPKVIWPLLKKEKVIVISETYAYKYNTAIGSKVSLNTDLGEKEFPVVGIFYDYTYEGGVIITGKKTYESFWHDKGISNLAIYTEDDINTEELIKTLREKAGKDQEILIQSSQALREETLSVFNRTFKITSVLRLLVMVVAFIGILNALMALQLERAREMAILRATGLTPGQLWWLIILQTGLMGIFAAVLAIILGIIIAIILIFIINRISFGWTMDMIIEGKIILQAITLSVSASLLAGIYPAIKMAGTSPAEALRRE